MAGILEVAQRQEEMGLAARSMNDASPASPLVRAVVFEVNGIEYGISVASVRAVLGYDPLADHIFNESVRAGCIQLASKPCPIVDMRRGVVVGASTSSFATVIFVETLLGLLAIAVQGEIGMRDLPVDQVVSDPYFDASFSRRLEFCLRRMRSRGRDTDRPGSPSGEEAV